MKSIAIICALVGLSACASSEIKVRCDAHLQPINPPATPHAEPQKGNATSPAPVDVRPARSAP